LLFGIKSGGQWLGFPASTSNVDSGGFHYVTGVFDGTTIRVYVDGVQQATAVLGTKILDSPSTSVQIASCAGGTDCGSSGEMWKGVIDDVRIYNRALTPAEVVTDMNAPVQ
jgi:hypothetical protein